MTQPAFLLFLAAALLYFWLTTDKAQAISPQERYRHDEFFRQKVRDLEIDYKDKLPELRSKTVWLAFLGYGVVWGSIALLIATGIGIGMAAIKYAHVGNLPGLVGLIPIGFALKLAKSLLSPRGGDSGVRIYRKNAPTLFRLLDKIRKKGGGPAFERVFINMEMNASVSRHTGLAGFFGFGPVTLTLGLPLMQALSTGQLAGVVGHEYGHVAARDNALGQWVYRIRNSWLYLEENLKTERLWYTLRLNRFYRWFMGIFKAYSFTLSRQCEYEADAFAAKVAGAKNIAGALVVMELRAEQLRHGFWDDIWKKSALLPEPAGAPYQRLGSFLKKPLNTKEHLPGLAKAVTGYDSTHPALPDRISALRETITAPETLTLSAASRLLGEPLEAQLATVFDKAWYEHNRDVWKKRHQEYLSASRVLEILQSRKVSSLTRDELAQIISAAHVLQDDRKIMAACQEIMAREPDNIAANINLLGLRLINDNNESALLKMDDLVRLHPEYMPTACRFAIRHLKAQEREEEAKVYQFRLDEWQYSHQAAEEERKLIFPTDIFTPHNIMPEYIKKLTSLLKLHSVVGKAWMARKDVDYIKDKPIFVIGLQPGFWHFRRHKNTITELKRALAQSNLPPYFEFFWVRDVKGLKKRLKKVKGSRIY